MLCAAVTCRQMVLLVPSVIKHRLRPGGRALLCCAVREKVRSTCVEFVQVASCPELNTRMGAVAPAV